MILAFNQFVALSLILLCLSCDSEHEPPYSTYEALINDLSMIAEVEILVRSFAKNNDLKIYEKSRSEMSALTEGRPAFFIALYSGGEPIMIVTNAGVGNRLILTVTDYQTVPLSELESLTRALISEFEQLHFDFKNTIGDRP